MREAKQTKHGIPLRLESFRKYCIEEGYELLAEDYRFIDRMLSEFSRSDFNAILKRYLEEWSIGIKESRSSISEQGQGRTRANKWLFERCDDRKRELMEIKQKERVWDTCFD